MLTLTQRTSHNGPPDGQLVLPFELRSKSRLRTALQSGEEAAVMSERGTVLRGGDRLLATDGRVIEVVAALELLSTARADDVWHLTRVAYHLGNRHVALQIGQGWVRYQHDHVLDEMVRGLGLRVEVEEAAFEPEAGAYGGHAHGHSTDHSIIRGVK
ncbi:MAG: urease accessory protein UreE [Povalibacter sp.]